MDTFYEPLLQMETFVQIRERLKKDQGLQLVTGCVDSQKNTSDVRNGTRLAGEIDSYL